MKTELVLNSLCIKVVITLLQLSVMSITEDFLIGLTTNMKLLQGNVSSLLSHKLSYALQNRSGILDGQFAQLGCCIMVRASSPSLGLSDSN